MPQLLLGCNAISDQSLQFLRLRKSAFLLTGKDDLAFESDVQDASLARNECDTSQLLLKRRQEFLGHPGGPQEPAATRAVFDFNSRLTHTESPGLPPMGRSGGHIGRAPLVCSGDCNSRWGRDFASSGLGEQFTATDSNTARWDGHQSPGNYRAATGMVANCPGRVCTTVAAIFPEGLTRIRPMKAEKSISLSYGIALHVT